MRIFFTTPFKGKTKYQPYIDEVIRVCEESGAEVVSPEKDRVYQSAFTDKKLEEFGNKDRAHYEFIRQGIAGVDAVIFEASYEDFRVGHEATLALMYDKPVLVLSQNEDYSRYIHHHYFSGKKYKDLADLQKLTTDFLRSLDRKFNEVSYQAVGEIVDLQHSAALSKLRYKALTGKTHFSDWARGATKEPDKTYEKILEKLGELPVQ